MLTGKRNPSRRESAIGDLYSRYFARALQEETFVASKNPERLRKRLYDWRRHNMERWKLFGIVKISLCENGLKMEKKDVRG